MHSQICARVLQRAWACRWASNVYDTNRLFQFTGGLESDGRFVVRDLAGVQFWTTGSTGTPSHMEVSDAGNALVKSVTGSTIWQI